MRIKLTANGVKETKEIRKYLTSCEKAITEKLGGQDALNRLSTELATYGAIEWTLN
jgi:hypothetical protein